MASKHELSLERMRARKKETEDRIELLRLAAQQTGRALVAIVELMPGREIRIPVDVLEKDQTDARIEFEQDGDDIVVTVHRDA